MFLTGMVQVFKREKALLRRWVGGTALSLSPLSCLSCLLCLIAFTPDPGAKMFEELYWGIGYAPPPPPWKVKATKTLPEHCPPSHGVTCRYLAGVGVFHLVGSIERGRTPQPCIEGSSDRAPQNQPRDIPGRGQLSQGPDRGAGCHNG